MVCKKCGNDFMPQKGLVNYCSLKCRNSREWDDDDKLKKSIGTYNAWNRNAYGERLIELNKNCPSCNIIFKANKYKKYCCVDCYYKSDIIRHRGRISGLKSALLKNKRSKNEIYFYELCKNKFEDIDNNKPIFNGWDADIILHNKKIAILWNGIWHYKKIFKKHSLEQVQNRDIIKKNEISKYGYSIYEIKDLGKYNKKFVEEQFGIFVQWFSTSPS